MRRANKAAYFKGKLYKKESLLKDDIDLILEKKRIRQFLKERRACISELDHAEFSQRITQKVIAHPKVIEAQTIFAFVSWSSEVNTHSLIKMFLNQGKTVVVPKILSANRMEAQLLKKWSDLKEDRLGILAPLTSTQFNGEVDLVITPGLGFTDSGHRIGFGAGYYDRWFASHAVEFKLAVAFEVQIVDSLPIEATDIPVDLIITEKRELKTKPS